MSFENDVDIFNTITYDNIIVLESLYENIKVDIKENKIIEFPKDEILVPDIMKMKELEDMKRLKYKLTRSFLVRYGFYNYEINWLLMQGEDIEDDR